ncbi:MAG: DUF362 domain-containing protein [Methanobacteriaceae archaeon]
MEDVSIVKCNSYDLKVVKKQISAVLDNIGGLDSFISKDDNVLIKPNMLAASKPEEGVTTHPSIVEAVACEVLDIGAIPTIGDSPGGAFKNINRFYKATGFYDVAKKLDIELANFESEGSYIKEEPNSSISNGMNKSSHSSFRYPIAKRVLDSDFVINLPKAKTHGLTLYSGAIKNMYGSVPGLAKVDFHRISPLPSEFAERVVDIFELSKPNLNIYDAVIGMEGMGPSAGDLRKIGLLLASTDAVAADFWLCNYLGKKPDSVPSLRIAKERGLGEGNLDNINIITNNSDTPNSIIEDITRFKFPSNINQTMEYIPSSLAKGIMKLWWSRPAIYEDICKNCNICLESCPTDAINIGEKAPSFDYSKCINCLCCIEMCDKRAMYMEKSVLYRITSLFTSEF